MKFTLNEKYMLKEAKFILDERFTLTEATKDYAEPLQTVLDKITASYNNVLQNLENLHSSSRVLSALKKTTNAVNNARKNKANYKVIQERISDYLNELKNYKNLIDKTGTKYADLTQLIDKMTEATDKVIGTTAGSEQNTQKAYEDLVADYDKLSKLVDIIFYTGTASNTDYKSQLNDTYDKLKKVVEEIKVQDLLNNTSDKNDAKIADAISKITSLAELTDPALLATDKNKYFEQCIDTLQKITEQINIIMPLAKEAGEAEKAKAEEEAAAERARDEEEAEAIADEKRAKLAAAAEKADEWTAEYNRVSSPEQEAAFWQKYFKEEWANKITNNLIKVRLEEEIEVLGFNPGRNTFIAYLHDIIDNFDNIFEILNKSDYAYNEIHNAVAKHYINYQDLVSGGECGNTNLIYCPAFYTATAADMSEYIELQKDCVDKARANAALSDRIKAKNYSSQLSTSNVSSFCRDLFYNGGSIITGTAGDITKGIKSVNRVKDEYELAFGKKEEVKNIDVLMTEWNLNNLSLDEAKSVIVWLLNKLAGTDKKALQNKYPPLKGLIMDDNVIEKYDLSTKFDKKKMNGPLVQALLIKLAQEADLIEKPAEEAK